MNTRLIFAVFVVTLSAVPAQAEVVEVDHQPPLFTLADEKGQIHQLEDLLGKPIVLYFTHNMCHYCTQIIAFLKRAHAAHEGSDLTIVTINVWAKGEKLIRRYKEQFGLPFRMLAGKNPKLLKDYEVNYVPIVVFVGRDGLVKRIYHHFILKQDFHESVKLILEEE
jgi:peroxiredoxin